VGQRRHRYALLLFSNEIEFRLFISATIKLNILISLLSNVDTIHGHDH